MGLGGHCRGRGISNTSWPLKVKIKAIPNWDHRWEVTHNDTQRWLCCGPLISLEVQWSQSICPSLTHQEGFPKEFPGALRLCQGASVCWVYAAELRSSCSVMWRPGFYSHVTNKAINTNWACRPCLGGHKSLFPLAGFTVWYTQRSLPLAVFCFQDLARRGRAQ